MPSPPARRCICGRSQTPPLCDGSHSTDGWRCVAATAPVHARLFVAAPHNDNIAERLAHARQGVALHRLAGPVVAASVVVITDGAELDLLTTSLGRVSGPRGSPPRQRVVLLGGDPALLRGAFPGSAVESVPDEGHPVLLWRRLTQLLDASPPEPSTEPPPRLFLSHATADEPLLQPAIALLRRLGVSVFVCGDSIPGGARWWDTILSSLHQCDRLVLVLSEAARRSTWCAFEVGAAAAVGKPIRVISLDGQPPPSFVSHLQMFDVPRMLRQRPWLTQEDSVLEAILSSSVSES
ncbi:MAG: TIR domain-containing protein [Myxococcota bacterium]|nr:TIR domain-containing protein [Myxococcota bacterium]